MVPSRGRRDGRGSALPLVSVSAGAFSRDRRPRAGPLSLYVFVLCVVLRVACSSCVNVCYVCMLMR
jgi:hypothetical protein